MPPAEPPVPMAMMVVLTPVPMLMVDDGPIPRLRVSAWVELPTVMAPVPLVAPMVSAPASEAGLSLLTAREVPVAEVKVKLVVLILVEVTLVPVAVVKPNAPDKVPPTRGR